MNENFANRLEKAMQIRNIKATELSEKANIPKSAISQYLSGLYEAKQKSIFKLARVLDVSEAWLMGLDVPMERESKINTGHISSPNSALVFIYGTIPAGVPMECIEDIIDTEEISTDMLKGGKQYFGLKIKGNSMETEYRNGDIIICEKVDDCESGDECVVMVNGNDGTFKKVLKNENGIILQPLNPSYEPMVYTNEQIETLPIKIIGKVVEMRRKKK
jgi:repressor LexA